MEVMDKVQMHYDKAATIVPKEQIVGVFLRGSQNYNCDTKNSDVDTLCLVVPSLEDFARNKKPIAMEVNVGDDGGHVTFMDIREFINQLSKQNPNILEVLFTKFAIVNRLHVNNWNQLYAYREGIAYYRPHAALNTIFGMANTEFKKMSKYGYTHKGLALIFRLENLLTDYLLCKKYEYALRSDEADFIRKVKCGEFVEDPVEGMELANKAISNMKTFVDNYIEKTPDVPNQQVWSLLSKMQYKFCRDFLEWEMG